jgi:RNA polymerase sigma-70 factor (ECF subfamily)
LSGEIVMRQQESTRLSAMESTNEEWLAALRGPESDRAIADLRVILLLGLRTALTRRSEENLDSFLAESAQDALVKILNDLDSFQGESRFTTWAQKIAVNVAFTELRRRRWRDTSLNELRDSPCSDFISEDLADPSVGPQQQAMQRGVLNTLRRLIREELTDRQRQAMQAVLRGMPLQEIAERMGTNRSALYKLLYDARLRLQKRMLADGLSPQEVLAAFDR